MKELTKYFYVFFFFLTVLFIDSSIEFKIRKNLESGILEHSFIENRKKSIFQEFNNLTKDKVLNTTKLQDNFEETLIDNFWLSDSIKYFFNSDFKIVDYNKLPKKLCKDNYVKVDNDYAVYDCSDMIVYYPYSKDRIYSALQKKLKYYDSINKNIDTYYYYIPNSYAIDFSKNTPVIDIEQELKKNFKNPYTYSSLKINNFSDFKSYFFKTDHHWNYKGSYQGYKDIISMVSKDEPIKPIDEVTFKCTNFYGTISAITSVRDFKEEFSVYKFKLPDYSKFIHSSYSFYGINDKNDKYTNDICYPFWYHYYEYYGEDFSLIIYDFHNEEKENVLIVSNSFIKSNRDLIASHFNKTYVINFNNYVEDYGKEFDIRMFVEDNDIDKVIFVYDMWAFTSEKYDIEWR